MVSLFSLRLIAGWHHLWITGLCFLVGFTLYSVHTSLGVSTHSGTLTSFGTNLVEGKHLSIGFKEQIWVWDWKIIWKKSP